MRFVIYGAAPSAAFLALSLQLSGHEVTWKVLLSRKRRFRPLRLSARSLMDFRSLFASHAPELSKEFLDPYLVRPWIVPGFFENPIDLFSGFYEQDYYFSEELLFDLSWLLAKKIGISQEEVATFEEPLFEEGQFYIADVESFEMRLWPRPFVKNFVQQRSKKKYEECQIWLPEVGALKQNDTRMNLVEYFKRQSVHFVLEPHTVRGFVLSLFSESKMRLEQEVQNLFASYKGTAVGAGFPSRWQSLFLMNPEAPKVFRTTICGPSEIEGPGVFFIGSSIGVLPPLGNRQAELGLEQARQLIDRLSEVVDRGLLPMQNEASTWHENHVNVFHRECRMARLWEAAFSSAPFRRYFVTFSAVLPSSLRHALKAPV